MQTVKRKPIANKLFDESIIMNNRADAKRKEKESETRNEAKEEKDSSYNSKYDLEEDL